MISSSIFIYIYVSYKFIYIAKKVYYKNVSNVLKTSKGCFQNRLLLRSLFARNGSTQTGFYGVFFAWV